MLLKLLKYDFRSMGKSLFPVWIACLLIGLVNGYIVPREAGIDMINDRLLSNISVPAFYGILFALLTAVIVFTVLGHGSYRSLISTADSVENAGVASPAEAQAAPEDK